MLAHCPRCDFALAGLPEAHRCPECGGEYDAASRVWYPRSRWAGQWPTGLVALLGLTILSTHFWRELRGYSLPIVAVIVACALVVLALLYWPALMRVINPRDRRIAILPDGVFLRTHEVEEFVAWDVIVSAEAFVRRVQDSREDRAVRIELAQGNAVEAVGIFASDAERDEFVALVNARLSMAGAAARDT